MLTFKLLLVGDSNVGKSSLLERYCFGKYSNEYSVTIGAEFSSKVITVDNKVVKLQIWDTAGQESFRSIIKSFYIKSSVVFLLYNVANRKSFDSISFWLKEAKEYAEKYAVFALVAAQSDREQIEVKREEGEEFQKANDLDFFFEVSAKNNHLIDECFETAAKAVLAKQEQLSISSLSVISDSYNNSNKGSSDSANLQLQPQAAQGGHKKSRLFAMTNSSCC